MKIAITTVQIPFVQGGAELLAENLKTALISKGHEAEIVRIPFSDSPLSLVENQIVAMRLLDLNRSWGGEIDLCIGLKFPAYYIPHDNKVLWALHQHRAAYDLFGTPLSNIPDDAEGNRVRELIHAADNRYLPEAKRIYTIADNVTSRLRRFNGIGAQTLYHPCPGMQKIYPGAYGDYLLMPSRINLTKRQKLAVEALAKTKTNCALYFVGRADNPVEKENLERFVREHGLQNRVRFFDFVSEEEKHRLYAGARGVVFIPVDEDYGYITLEAMAAHKPVITCTDSGGPLEFVADGETGFVVQPNAQEIAKAMDALFASPALAPEYGEAAARRLQEMNITWDHVVEELTRT